MFLGRESFRFPPASSSSGFTAEIVSPEVRLPPTTSRRRKKMLATGRHFFAAPLAASVIRGLSSAAKPKGNFLAKVCLIPKKK